MMGHRSKDGTYINSIFHSDTEVFGSPFIRDSQIENNARVFGGWIANSVVRDDSIIAGGSVLFSVISHKAVIADKAKALWSGMNGASRLLDRAVITGVELDDFAVVCETAKVTSVNDKVILKDWDYLHMGSWTRRPITYHASLSGLTVGECVDGHINIGCICNTPKKFLNAGVRYGRMLGLDEDQFAELRELVLIFT